MARAELAASAVEALRTHSLPDDTAPRVVGSLRRLERFPLLGRALTGLELVESDGVAGAGLFEPETRPLEGTRDPVEQLDDVAGVGFGLVEGARRQRASERPGLHVHAVGEPCELRALLGVQGDVQPLTTPGFRY